MERPEVSVKKIGRDCFVGVVKLADDRMGRVTTVVKQESDAERLANQWIDDALAEYRPGVPEVAYSWEQDELDAELVVCVRNGRLGPRLVLAGP